MIRYKRPRRHAGLYTKPSDLGSRVILTRAQVDPKAPATALREIEGWHKLLDKITELENRLTKAIDLGRGNMTIRYYRSVIAKRSLRLHETQARAAILASKIAAMTTIKYY